FSNSSQFGQTGPTQIRIRVTDFPDGLQILFPASVTAKETAATLTTGSGNPVALTSATTASANNIVTYACNKGGNSDDTTESFDIQFTVSVIGTLGDLQPTIEVTLAPIGAATPSSTFPATDTPRYAEDEALVQAGSSRIIQKVLYWTGIDSSLQNEVHMTNPSN